MPDGSLSVPELPLPSASLAEPYMDGWQLWSIYLQHGEGSKFWYHAGRVVTADYGVFEPRIDGNYSSGFLCVL